MFTEVDRGDGKASKEEIQSVVALSIRSVEIKVTPIKRWWKLAKIRTHRGYNIGE